MKGCSLFSRIPPSREEQAVNKGHVILLQYMNLTWMPKVAELRWKWRPRLQNPFSGTRPPWVSTAASLAVLTPPFPHWSLFCHHFQPLSCGRWISPDEEGERTVELLSLSCNGIQSGGGRRDWVKERQNNEKRTLYNFRIPLLSTIRIYRNSSIWCYKAYAFQVSLQ